jgi:hypothetical protein
MHDLIAVEKTVWCGITEPRPNTGECGSEGEQDLHHCRTRAGSGSWLPRDMVAAPPGGVFSRAQPSRDPTPEEGSSLLEADRGQSWVRTIDNPDRLLYDSSMIRIGKAVTLPPG